MSEQEIEQEIQAKNLNAPRLSPQMIDDTIISEVYARASEVNWHRAQPGDSITYTALSCLTLCVLTLKNGFTVVGKSGCASPENFDYELGRKIAREDARRRIWALEGYRLRSQLNEEN